MEVGKKPFKWIDKEEWDFHNKQLPSRYIAGCDPIEENSQVKILPLQEYTGYRWDNLNKHAMENEKYYIPSLEEFHVGFEFEVSNDIVAGALEVKPPKEWYKQVFGKSDPYTFEFIEYNLGYKLGMIRVKYLDKEDIESLGFSIYSKLINVWRYKKPYNKFIYNDESTWSYWHITLMDIKKSNYYKIPNVCINNQEYNDDTPGVNPNLVTIFEGTIKNISELKILLKQLNIL